MKTLFASISENVQFVLLCLAVTAAVVLLAWGGERLVMKKRHRLNTAHTITTVGMLAAISGVLMVIELPLFFAPPFYKLDFSELPVLICAFSLGPVAGVVCEFLKVLIHLLLKGTSTAFVGDLANFLVGCSFVLPASILYQKLLSKKGAVASLALGTGVMTVFGSLFNAWFLIPRFAVVRPAARRHHRHGHAGQRRDHRPVHARAAGRRAVQPAQGRAGVRPDVLPL